MNSPAFPRSQVGTWVASFGVALCLITMSACGRPQRTTEQTTPSEKAPAQADAEPAGDGDKAVALSFASGTTGRTVADTLAGFALHDYVLRASRGQRLSADLRTSGPALVLVSENHGYAPGGDFKTVEPDVQDDGVNGLAPGFLWEGTLPHDGEYRVRVAHSGPAANQGAVSPYELAVSVDGAPTSSQDRARRAPGDRLPDSVAGTFDETRTACAETLTTTRLIVSPDTLEFYYGHATVDSVASRGRGYDVGATLYQLEGAIEVVPEPITYRIEPRGEGILFGPVSGSPSHRVRCNGP